MESRSSFCLLVVPLLAALALGAPHSQLGALSDQSEDTIELPEGFLIGAGSSALQVEGAWNTSGKGESNWDRFLHDRPYLQNGDVACDGYHKYKEDVALLGELKLQVYRFSLAWSRLLPTGKIDNVNPDGLRYYNDLIDQLLSHNIEPMVTLYHLGIPIALEEEGGWLNPKMVQYFEDFATLAFKHFGDRVRRWVTINEPRSECKWGYGGAFFAPGLNKSGTADYVCGHHQLLAHAAAYRTYQRHFKHQGGSVGLTVGVTSALPKDPDSLLDKLAAQREMEFQVGWFLDPIYYGDYPASMRAAAGDRLPNLTAEQRRAVTDTIDYIAVNTYSGTMVASGVDENSVSDPSQERDKNTTLTMDPSWPTGPRWNFGLSPGSMRMALRWVSARYNNTDMFVTETGWCASADEGLDDRERIAYLSNQLREVVTAVRDDGCRVLGLTSWSFMDNLEVSDGFKLKFGLVHVDFSSPALTRTPKSSAYFLSKVARERRVPRVKWPRPAA